MNEQLAATALKRWNIGSGEYPLLYFINLDADPTVRADIHATVPPIPADDGALAYIWACHFLEHLDRDGGREFLRECFRVLEPGGRCGIVVPDTREIMTRWLAGTIDAVEYPPRVWHSMADLDEVCALFLYCDIQDSRHQWSYDRETLGRAMGRAGFVELKEIDRYRYPLIAQGAWYQVGIEGVKPK